MSGRGRGRGDGGGRGVRGGNRGGGGGRGADNRGGRGSGSVYRGGRGGGDDNRRGDGEFRRSRGGNESRGGRGGDFRGERGRGGGAPQFQNVVGPINMKVNHFLIDAKDDAMPIFRHEVSIVNTSFESSKIIRERNEILLRELLAKKVPWKHLAYDGDKILIAKQRINLVEDVTLGKYTYNVIISPQGGAMTIRDLLQSGDQPFDSSKAQMVEIILKTAAKQNAEPIKAQTFSNLKKVNDRNWMIPLYDLVDGAAAKSEVGPRHLWLGHFQAATLTRNPKDHIQATLCVNAAGAIAYPEMPLIDYLRQRTGFDVTKDIPLPDRVLKLAASVLRGLRFETRHIRNEKRELKLCGLVNESARSYKFDCNGQQITVEKYFRDQYNVQLKHPRAAMTQKVPKSRQTYLPIESVWLKRQTTTAATQTCLKSAVGDIMTMDPNTRLQHIKEVVHDVFGSNDVLREFGLVLNEEEMVVSGTVLCPPKLLYHRPQKAGVAVEKAVSNGSWNLREIAFTAGARVNTWAIINTSDAPEEKVYNFIECIVRQAKDLNIQMAPKPVKIWWRERADTLRSIGKTFSDNAAKGVRMDLLFIFTQERDTMIYKEIKTLFDNILPTQVLVKRKTPLLNGKDRGYEGHLGNILSKVNQKLGGVNQAIYHQKCVSAVLKQLLGTGNQCCILGADISRPASNAAATGARRLQLPSLAAMVCSIDSEACKYIHSMRAQEGSSDIMGDFRPMLSSLLRRRAALTGGKWPQRIVYLRDGVSDAEFSNVIAAEIDTIQTVYKEALQSPPNILAVAVRRKHQTRFFPTAMSQTHSNNLPPGTLMFDNLTMPLPFPNFYLLSHAGIKGTSHPCRYIVVRDDFSHHDPEFKRLSSRERLERYAHVMFQLCHMYGRAQKSVSMPAPIYYASQLAERARMHSDELAKSVLHISLMPDDGASLSSGGCNDPVSEAQLQGLIDRINSTLSRLEETTSPMFYC